MLQPQFSAVLPAHTFSVGSQRRFGGGDGAAKVAHISEGRFLAVRMGSLGSGEPEHLALGWPVERDGIDTDEPAAGEL